MRIISNSLTSLGEHMLRLSGLVLIFMLLLQIIIVALRYGFAIGTPWAQDLVTYSFCFTALLPTLAVITGNTSVRVDIFYSDMPRRWQSRIDRVALFFFLAPALSYGALRSLDSTIISWKLLEASPTYGGMPGYYILKSLLTLCLFLIALAALVQSIDQDPYHTAEQNK